MRGGNQLFGIGAGRVLKTRGKRVGSIGEHSARRGDAAFSILQTTLPYCTGFSLHSRSSNKYGLDCCRDIVDVRRREWWNQAGFGIRPWVAGSVCSVRWGAWSACRRSASAGPETEETAKICTAPRARESRLGWIRHAIHPAKDVVDPPSYVIGRTARTSKPGLGRPAPASKRQLRHVQRKRKASKNQNSSGRSRTGDNLVCSGVREAGSSKWDSNANCRVPSSAPGR